MKLLEQAKTPEDQIADILEEDANQLAQWLDFASTQVRPHRVDIAVGREIERLRCLAMHIRPNDET